jgi:hypothetical protein
MLANKKLFFTQKDRFLFWLGQELEEILEYL